MVNSVIDEEILLEEPFKIVQVNYYFRIYYYQLNDDTMDDDFGQD